jgi:hypothetical protein
MSLNHLVQPPVARALHGSVEFWARKARKVGGGVEVDFERKRDGLSFGPARLIVYIIDAAGERVERSPEPWDMEVNEDLVSIGAKAGSVENEVERAGYALKFQLEPAEVRYGDGYFNSMLVLMLTELGFAKIPSVERCLARTSAAAPSRDSMAFGNAQQDIKAALRAVGGQLTGSLEYSPETAQQILADAVAYYLDERFHITNRERLGFR